MTAARISNLSLSRARAAVEDTRERTRARERSVRSFGPSVRSVRPFGPFRPSVRRSVRRALRALDRARRPLDARARSREAVVEIGRSSVGAIVDRRAIGRSSRGRRSVAARSRRPIPPSTSRERSCLCLVSVSVSIHPSPLHGMGRYYSRVRTHPWVRPRSVPRFSGGKM